MSAAPRRTAATTVSSPRACARTARSRAFRSTLPTLFAQATPTASDLPREAIALRSYESRGERKPSPRATAMPVTLAAASVPLPPERPFDLGTIPHAATPVTVVSAVADSAAGAASGRRGSTTPSPRGRPASGPGRLLEPRPHRLHLAGEALTGCGPGSPEASRDEGAR